MAKANKNRRFIEMRSFQQKIMSFTKHLGSEAPKDGFFAHTAFPGMCVFGSNNRKNSFIYGEYSTPKASSKWPLTIKSFLTPFSFQNQTYP